MRKDETEKSPTDPANRWEAIPLDDPFWTVAAFAAAREVEMTVRMRARRDPLVLRWRSGDTGAQEAGIERLGKIRFERDAERMGSAYEKYEAEKARLGNEARWPSPFVEEVPSPSVRTPTRPTSADRAANYLGAVSGPISRLAQNEERDLCTALRRPLHLFLYGGPIFTDRENAWERYRKVKEDRRTITEQYGIGSVELLSVLVAIGQCEEGGETCEPLAESVRAAGDALSARLNDPSSLRHVRDAYAATVWEAKNSKGQGGVLRIDDGSRITGFRYGPQCKYLQMLEVASQVVAARYRSSAESALLFLIAGQGLSFKVAQIDYQTEDRPAALARIVLTVDPTLSPDEVRRLYRHAREKVLKDQHHQDAEEATMALASFVYSQTAIRTEMLEDEARSGDVVDFDEGWRRLMDRWTDGTEKG